MSWTQTPAGVWTPERASGRAPMALPSSESSTRGMPAYRIGLGEHDLQPEISPRQMGIYLASLPLLSRAVKLLVGMVGCPRVVTGSERTDAEWQTWVDEVEYGWIGRGLAAWLRDHLFQALVYGYGVGEAEIALPRNEIPRLWGYTSASCVWRSMQDGTLQVRQRAGLAGWVALDPLTCLTTTHAPCGSDPRGTSIFRAIPTLATLQMEMYRAYRQVWQRVGVPIFHVNWETPETLDDPTGAISAEVRASLQTSWVDAMKSSVVDGVTKDFFSTGRINIEPVGSKSEVMDIQASKRAVTEELVSATGLPAWMLGYTWSTTERLSQQQADLLTGIVWALRREAEPVLRKIVDLRQRLLGRGEAVRLEWDDVSLQDLTETAKARLTDAQADEARERLARTLWTQGVYDQAQYATHVTGSDAVAEARDAPTGSGFAPEPTAALEGALAYPGSGCKHARKEPTFPTERPQYPALARQIERTERAIQQAYDEMRARMLAIVRGAAGARAVKNLTPSQLFALDQAIESFLTEVAGEDRSELGFVNAAGNDSILHRGLDQATRAGADRAAGLAGGEPGRIVPEYLRQRVRRECFEQLSDGSKLRFADRLGEIRDGVLGALERGESVADVVAQLGAELDAYSVGRLRTIVRTEIGRASETVLREDLRTLGVTRVKVIGDLGTDPLCTEHIGSEYDLADTDQLPLYHPNCLCSVVPL